MTATTKMPWIVIGTALAVIAVATVAIAASSSGMMGMGGGMMGGMGSGGIMGPSGSMMTPEKCQATMGNQTMVPGSCPHPMSGSMDPAHCGSMMG